MMLLKMSLLSEPSEQQLNNHFLKQLQINNQILVAACRSLIIGVSPALRPICCLNMIECD